MKNPTIESFLNDVKNHEITVNLDQGVYRDITIANPNSMCMHYNVTTRPGFLMITGDMGDFIFERAHDMFNFFRSEDTYRINTGYWGEKVKAGEVSEFDIDTANEAVKTYLMNYLEDLDLSNPDDQSKSEKALQAVNAFISDTQGLGEYDFWQEINNWDKDEAGGLVLDDFFEVTTTAKKFHFVWACYAIVHAIKLYDAYQVKFVEKNHE